MLLQSDASAGHADSPWVSLLRVFKTSRPTGQGELDRNASFENTPSIRGKVTYSMAQNRVLVLDFNHQPLMPCHPARARQLLSQDHAAVWRRFPFTIVLKQPTTSHTQPLRLKVDPGSRTSGLAVVATYQRGLVCVFAAELQHRGLAIKEALYKRRGVRRSRRHRHTRYRKPRFLNRKEKAGWPPVWKVVCKTWCNGSNG